MAQKQGKKDPIMDNDIPENDVPFLDEEGINFQTDFNLQDEYKPEPLAPKGNYFGNVSAVRWDGTNQALIWSVVLTEENVGVMSDGETPMAGQVFDYRNWFPRADDKNEMSARGRTTKYQSKINMIKRFADDMQITMNTPQEIINAVTNQDWVGIPVVVSISIDQYKGRYKNVIDNMKRAQ